MSDCLTCGRDWSTGCNLASHIDALADSGVPRRERIATAVMGNLVVAGMIAMTGPDRDLVKAPADAGTDAFFARRAVQYADALIAELDK